MAQCPAYGSEEAWQCWSLLPLIAVTRFQGGPPRTGVVPALALSAGVFSYLFGASVA
ncbi:hypothetical protein [Streptomyces sp. cmx-18-6]|uniref:hypothetical protein n=1 Tax=Streptomyces sp. cmx-18-6 TaxID=2790930 RepID=UPI003980D778